MSEIETYLAPADSNPEHRKVHRLTGDEDRRKQANSTET